RRGRGSVTLDSRCHVGGSHSRFSRSVGPPHALDAGARPPQDGRYAGPGSGRAAAVVQGDARRGHAASGVPKNNGGTTAAVSCFDTPAHSGATGPFQSAAQAVAAALGPV